MKHCYKHLAIIVLGMMTTVIAQAGDMDSAVAYSLGEFDRVGVNQPAPKVQSGVRSGPQKPSATSSAQTAQERQLAARKAEFVRRIFWLAVAAR